MQTLCRSRIREKIASGESQEGAEHHSPITLAKPNRCPRLSSRGRQTQIAINLTVMALFGLARICSRRKHARSGLI